MKIHWQALAEHLRREVAEHGQLLRLLEDQHALILRNAPTAVLEAGRAIEEQVRSVDRERAAREEAVAGFALERGLPASGTLRSLLPHVGADAQPLFQALIGEVNLLMHRVRRDARRNQRLLQCTVECRQEILRRLRPDAFTKTYARDGRVSLAAIRPAATIHAGT